jgi:RNA recognition motif-containing protein
LFTSPGCSEETLRNYFVQFGPLESAEIMKDRYTGKSRGFGAFLAERGH